MFIRSGNWWMSEKTRIKTTKREKQINGICSLCQKRSRIVYIRRDRPLMTWYMVCENCEFKNVNPDENGWCRGRYWESGNSY
jgi:hypothetical protein